jgi:hypothetical protein
LLNSWVFSRETEKDPSKDFIRISARLRASKQRAQTHPSGIRSVGHFSFELHQPFCALMMLGIFGELFREFPASARLCLDRDLIATRRQIHDLWTRTIMDTLYNRSLSQDPPTRSPLTRLSCAIDQKWTCSTVAGVTIEAMKKGGLLLAAGLFSPLGQMLRQKASHFGETRDLLPE